ncbi:hypothetical protein RB620_28495 [Paenibacillus sp. LHD-117]|uniref:hypothetical protein n=1 Tax=Paenibacillus sp. LHD-117 TaxID=3071412 RepID=UPI0027DF525A|nr:hypothetical protein [Paenibacillus sp. LHD-117]MDQ6423375.1 hypothetical protein [Paenibacillus sp. LHD-117]
MERIYPLNDEHLQHIIGMPVCAVMNNGLRYVGIAESCKSGRLGLTIPSYEHGFGYPAESHDLSDDRQARNSQNEQTIQPEQTASTKKRKPVRGKKQLKQTQATASAKEAVFTNYAEGGNNPAAGTSADRTANGIKLDLEDIYLLFLIV